VSVLARYGEVTALPNLCISWLLPLRLEAVLLLLNGLLLLVLHGLLLKVLHGLLLRRLFPLLLLLLFYHCIHR